MKKSFAKPLKLEIKPVFQFSTADNGRSDFSDPITITITTITKVSRGGNLR